jgi:outer membrane receptor protein involved in Fe transport
VSAFGDPTTTNGYLGGVGPPTFTNGTIDEGGSDATIKYEGVLGSQWIINGQIARHSEKNITTGAGMNIVSVEDFTHPLWLNTGIEVHDGGLGYVENPHFERDLYNASTSYFLNNFGGDHEFKLGAEYEHIPIDVYRQYSGGQFKYNYGDFWIHRFFATQQPPDGDWSVYDNSFILNPLIVKSKTDNTAAFLQDTWHLFTNLTVNLGLRWESQKLYNRGGTVSLDIKDNWAPRLGIVWDPASNGKTKVYGSWGRFYEAIPSDMVIRSFGGEIITFSYNYDSGDNVLCSPDFYPPNGCAALGGAYEPVDPRTKGQYVEEAIVGGEVEVAKDLIVSGKYIYRSLGRVIEDSLLPDLNYQIGNPGQGTESTGCDMSYVCTYSMPLPRRYFHGLEVDIRKRATNWQLMASYIYSKLEGTYDGTFQASTTQLDPNINSAYDYYEFAVHNRGPLTSDRPHQIKVDGTYAFPFGLNVGLAAYWRSGLPITAMGYSRNYANWEFYLSNRGAWGRTADEYEADLHLGYPLKMSGVEINLMLDVFNLLNRQGETSVDQHYDLTEPDSGVFTPIDYSTSTPRRAIKPGTPCPSFFTSSADAAQYCNPSFGKANAWQAPRSIRVGLRLSF